MTNYQPGDLVLIAFPYTAGAKTKNRPAMVILDTGDADVLVARVTTHNWKDDYGIILHEWEAAGLLAPSTVRLHKLAALEKALVQRRLGSLQGKDRAAVSATMRRIYGTW